MDRPRILFTKTHSNAIMPTRKHPGDAGYDLYALVNVNIPTNKTIIVPTGITIAVPKGFYAELHPRSSFALKGGYMKVGIIDEGYRGDIGTIVTALHEPIKIKKGDRIGQIIMKRRIQPTFIEIDELPDSQRGTQGFGSSGR
jgi:dUTP pyrophosphatase